MNWIVATDLGHDGILLEKFNSRTMADNRYFEILTSTICRWQRKVIYNRLTSKISFGPVLFIDPETDIAVIFLTNRVHPHDKGSVVRLRSLVAHVVAGAIIK